MPALHLWLLLLAMSGIALVYYQVTENLSPAVDLVFSTLALVIVLFFCCNEGPALSKQLHRIGLTRQNWWFTPAAFAFCWLLVTPYFSFLGWLGVENIEYLVDYREHNWPIWSAFLMIALYPAVVEELAFRGIIMNRLSPLLTPNELLIVQAIMFSVLHLSPAIFLSHFLIGLALGWLRQRTGSLYPGMVMHLAWNALVLLEEL